MGTNYPRTTAQLRGHPIHPMLVPFPIVLFVATLVCDVVFWTNAIDGVFRATIWILGAGLAMAALAAIAGVIEFIGDKRIVRLRDAWWHAGTNVTIVALEALNLYMRLKDGSAFVMPGGIALSAIATILLLFAGWKGGALVFRYRVGVRHNEEPL
ncbi:MAG: DUF2231 domain-containing protein [Alphaproteobacteria bacterium]|nr:DUF2231 domain-containing protein [Alphaproteobacteria bacterium]MCW5740827.1 DUF2231 domain-containing protein [Alphaproteobacteria bacterium]